MLRWSSSYTIPFEHNYDDEPFCINVGKEIWITSEEYYRENEKRMDMLVFDTETEEFRSVPCKIDIEYDIVIVSLSSVGNIIYMWSDERGDENGRILYKMDITSLEWVKVIKLDVEGVITNVVIIDNQMYLTAERDVVQLIIIDLSACVITQHTLSYKVDVESVVALTNDKKLYIVQHADYHRIISVIENGRMIRILENDYGSEKNCPYLFYKDLAGNIVYTDRPNMDLFMQSFNFGTMTWSRADIEPSEQFPRSERIKSSCQIGTQIYTILQSHRPRKYEIQVLEMEPNLTTICLFNLVDDLEKKKNLNRIQQVENRIPIDLR